MSTRKFTILEIEDAIRARIGRPPLHRFMNIHRNELTHSEDVRHIELSYVDLPFEVIQAAMKGLVPVVYPSSYATRPYEIRAVYENRPKEAAFRCEIRRYPGDAGYTRLTVSPLEPETPPKPIVQAGIMWEEGQEYFDHYIAGDRR